MLCVSDVCTWFSWYFYRLQRSCGKVMFSQASVILSTGTPPGGYPPWADTPRQTPPTWADTPHLGRHGPPGQSPPGRHPQADTPLPSACWETPPHLSGQTPLTTFSRTKILIQKQTCIPLNSRNLVCSDGRLNPSLEKAHCVESMMGFYT